MNNVTMLLLLLSSEGGGWTRWTKSKGKKKKRRELVACLLVWPVSAALFTTKNGPVNWISNAFEPPGLLTSRIGWCCCCCPREPIPGTRVSESVLVLLRVDNFATVRSGMNNSSRLLCLRGREAWRTPLFVCPMPTQHGPRKNKRDNAGEWWWSGQGARKHMVAKLLTGGLLR